MATPSAARWGSEPNASSDRIDKVRDVRVLCGPKRGLRADAHGGVPLGGISQIQNSADDIRLIGVSVIEAARATSIAIFGTAVCRYQGIF